MVWSSTRGKSGAPAAPAAFRISVTLKTEVSSQVQTGAKFPSPNKR